MINNKVSCLITQIFHADFLTRLIGESRSSVCCFRAECKGLHYSPHHTIRCSHILHPGTALESSYMSQESLSHWHEAGVYRMNNLDPGFFNFIWLVRGKELKVKQRKKKCSSLRIFPFANKIGMWANQHIWSLERWIFFLFFYQCFLLLYQCLISNSFNIDSEKK